MTITIENLTFQAILGILDFERKTPQDIIVNIEIEYTYKKDLFINYAEVVKLIKTTMKNKKYLLIEDALSDLSQILKENFSTINTLYLKISKPSILLDCTVSVADTFLFDS